MPSIAMAALLGATALAHGWYDYSVGYQTAVRENRELLVLITADWCGACRKLRGQVLPDPRLGPHLKPYVCTVVNVDRQPQLAEALGGKGAIPLLIAYNPTPRGWVRREIRGYQSAEKLARFLQTSPPSAGLKTTSVASRVAQSTSPRSRLVRDTSTRSSEDKRPTAVVQLLGIAPIK